MRTDVEHVMSGARPSLNLAGARTEKGVALEEIAHSTRIAPRFLEAIEAENFERLPGGLYNTSYIRQYARAIGYDETTLIEHYRSRIEPPVVAGAASPPGLFRVDETLRNFLQNVAARRRSHHAV